MFKGHPVSSRQTTRHEKIYRIPGGVVDGIEVGDGVEILGSNATGSHFPDRRE